MELSHFESQEREIGVKEAVAIKLVKEVGSRIAQEHPSIQDTYRAGVACEQIATEYDIANRFGLTDEIARNAVNYAIRILISEEERKEIFQRFSIIHATDGGKTAAALGLGIHGMSHEQKSAISKKNALENKEKRRGIFAMTTEERRAVGLKNKEEGKGMFAMSAEERRALALKNKEEGKGMFAMSAEERRMLGVKIREQGKGIFSLPKEKMLEIRQKGGRTLKEEGKGIFAMSAEERTMEGLKKKERKIGIHGLSREQRQQNTKKSLLAQGKVPWLVDVTEVETGLNEIDYCLYLATQSEFLIAELGPNFGKTNRRKIAQRINNIFHKGENVRSHKAVEGVLYRSRENK